MIFIQDSPMTEIISLYSLAFKRGRCVLTREYYLSLRLVCDGDESPEACSLLELQTLENRASG